MNIEERLDRVRSILEIRPSLPMSSYIEELEDHLRWFIEDDGLLQVVRDLLAENRRLREAARRACDELTEEAQRVGLYDKETPS